MIHPIRSATLVCISILGLVFIASTAVTAGSAVTEDKANIIRAEANMSDLEPLLSRFEIDVKYPMTIVFNDEGTVSQIHYATEQDSLFSAFDRSSTSDISFNGLSRSQISVGIDATASSKGLSDIDALLFIINEQFCTACGTEKRALESLAAEKPDMQLGVIHVNFQ